MFTLALNLIIAALLTLAAGIAIWLVGWWLVAGWLTRLLEWDTCWRVVWFVVIFAVLTIITFAVLGWLVANDPVLHTIRMPI